MIGDHGIAMMGDAILKEVPGFDYEEATGLCAKMHLKSIQTGKVM